MNQNDIPFAVRCFDKLPDAALIDVGAGILLTGRSRASIYRHFKAGDLTLYKVGNSARINVGELRQFIREANHAG